MSNQPVFKLGTCDTEAATEEALEAVIFTEIEKAIQHKAQEIAFAIGGDFCDTEIDRLKVSLLICDFSFEAEGPKIVANYSAKITTFIVIDRNIGSVHRCTINNHRASIDTNVPLALFS